MLLPHLRPELAEFTEDGLLARWVWDVCPVGADDFGWVRDQQGEWEAEALEADEDEIRRVADFASLAILDVQRELDGRADELAQFAEAEPDSGCTSQ
jgi:hypothetical protein